MSEPIITIITSLSLHIQFAAQGYLHLGLCILLLCGGQDIAKEERGSSAAVAQNINSPTQKKSTPSKLSGFEYCSFEVFPLHVIRNAPANVTTTCLVQQDQNLDGASVRDHTSNSQTKVLQCTTNRHKIFMRDIAFRSSTLWCFQISASA